VSPARPIYLKFLLYGIKWLKTWNKILVENFKGAQNLFEENRENLKKPQATLHVLLTVRLDILCNENQLYALLILHLFRQSTSTCFEHIYFRSSGVSHCICTTTVTLYKYGDWEMVGSRWNQLPVT
jgi:hypothetical protein